MFKIMCDACGYEGRYIPEEIRTDDTLESFVTCNLCEANITIPSEYLVENRIDQDTLEEILPVLKEGEVVLIDNKEHPLNNQIGLICERKHKHYRVEIQGKKIWMPEHWVKSHELDKLN